MICAANDGIILATIDKHSEPGSPPPAVTPLSGLRAGVILGAVEWVQPESKDAPVRLDAEFPRLVASADPHSPGQANYPERGKRHRGHRRRRARASSRAR